MSDNSDKSSKPREFWIPETVEDYEWTYADGTEQKLIEVIEKSAYDDMVKANDVLRATVLAVQDNLDKHIELNKRLLESHNELQAKLDKMTEVLGGLLLAVREEYEDYYRWISPEYSIPVTKEYGECIRNLSKHLVPTQNFIKECRDEK